MSTPVNRVVSIEVNYQVFLLLVFVFLTVVLGAALYVLSLFFQSYIYTQPSPGLAWRAPAAAAAMALFFSIWCFLVMRGDAGSIAFDAIHRFNPKVEMFAQAVPRLWTVRADGTKTAYLRRKDDTLRFVYVDERGKPYNRTGVVALEIDHEGNRVRLDKGITQVHDYRSFATPDGWVMQEFDDGPDGVPTQWRLGRLLGNLVLNLLHAGLWFVCLWLVLQFRVNDALGFAVVIWMIATLLLLPMLLDQAAAASRGRQTASVVGDSAARIC